MLSADNQQGSLSQSMFKLHPQYIVGFVDGEGSFHVAIYKDDRMKAGIKVIPEFHVSQQVSSRTVLDALCEYFACGYVKENHAKNNRDKTYVYVVRNRKINKIPTDIKVPVFYHITDGELHQANDYIETVTRWVDMAPQKAELGLDPAHIVKSGANLIEVVGVIYGREAGADEMIRIPFVDGFSSLSISEYVKKQNDDQSIRMVVGKNQLVVRVYYTYKTDSLTALSVHPAAFFYYRKHGEPKQMEIQP